MRHNGLGKLIHYNGWLLGDIQRNIEQLLHYIRDMQNELGRIGLLFMRSYSVDAYSYYRFDKAGYQQFLREQGLSEHDIKRLNIHFITDFTCSHFKGSIDLEEGGAFYQRCREYVEQENRTTRAFYRPYDPPSSEYAAIFLRPEKCHTPAHLNHTFLHETRHHIQHCLKLLCCSAVNAGIENEAHGAENQPWEVDAEQFARNYSKIASFLLPILRPLKRSDLR